MAGVAAARLVARSRRSAVRSRGWGTWPGEAVREEVARVAPWPEAREPGAVAAVPAVVAEPASGSRGSDRGVAPAARVTPGARGRGEAASVAPVPRPAGAGRAETRGTDTAAAPAVAARGEVDGRTQDAPTRPATGDAALAPAPRPRARAAPEPAVARIPADTSRPRVSGDLAAAGPAAVVQGGATLRPAVRAPAETGGDPVATAPAREQEVRTPDAVVEVEAALAPAAPFDPAPAAPVAAARAEATLAPPPPGPPPRGEAGAVPSTPPAWQAPVPPTVRIDRITVVTPPASAPEADAFASLAARRGGRSRHARWQ